VTIASRAKGASTDSTADDSSWAKAGAAVVCERRAASGERYFTIVNLSDRGLECWPAAFVAVMVRA
jgi:hypothetical protein